jgi:hypothetical protein
VSVYEPSPIKRQRRTKAELEDLDLRLAEIVEENAPITVRRASFRHIVGNF